MTITKNIGIPRPVHVLWLSWTSGDIIFGCQKSHLPYRNLPSVRHTPIGNPKFQSGQFPILTTDLKSTEKTDKRKCFPFSNIPTRRCSNLVLKLAKIPFPFNLYIK